MKKLFLILFLLSLFTNSYAKEADLLCKGSVTFIMPGISDVKDKELNFSFDDVRETVTSEGSLMCLSSPKLKSQTRQFTKQNIIVAAKTEDKEPADEGYCFYSFSLNRNSGQLETKKMENSEKIVAITNGKFKCELAKQKF